MCVCAHSRHTPRLSISTHERACCRLSKYGHIERGLEYCIGRRGGAPLSRFSREMEDTPWLTCQGFLFKLKENNKEWKKLYVVLKGGDIIYYDGPHEAQADKRQKDGIKRVVTAHSHEQFDGVNAPTGSPAYFVIETTHAKKTYCAKNVDEREMWVTSIIKNGERAARAAMLSSGTSRKGSVADGGGGSGGIFSRMIGRDRRSTHSQPKKEEKPRSESIASSMGFSRMGLGGRTSQPSISGSTKDLAADVLILDAELDEKLKEMLPALGLKGAQADAVMKLPNAQKREMLKVRRAPSRARNIFLDGATPAHHGALPPRLASHPLAIGSV
jgi:hypothetical protein